MSEDGALSAAQVSAGGNRAVKNINEMAGDTTGTSVTLEVCQGSDCFGSGGGAAILELEELANHHCFATTNSTPTSTTASSSPMIKVVAGGCRNFCSVGPNVHYFDGQGQHQQHFSKTLSVQNCYNVVDHVVAEHQRLKGRPDHTVVPASIEIQSNASSLKSVSSNRKGDIIKQRAEKKRWTFLRKVARAKVAHQSHALHHTQGRNIRELLNELEDVIAAEMGASRGDVQVLKRAARRKEHLKTTLKDLLISPHVKGAR